MRSIIVALVLLVAAPGAAFAGGDVTRVIDIINDSEGNAGAIVVEGELVGDYGRRSDGTVWTQLNDDAYVFSPTVLGSSGGANIGIGVRLPAALLDGLADPGGYRERGPVVRLEGVWKHHDPDRGGESYMEVSKLTLLEGAIVLEESADVIPAGIGIVLIAFAIGLRVLRRRGDATG
jgi:hypothetical protein